MDRSMTHDKSVIGISRLIVPKNRINGGGPYSLGSKAPFHRFQP